MNQFSNKRKIIRDRYTKIEAFIKTFFFGEIFLPIIFFVTLPDNLFIILLVYGINILAILKVPSFLRQYMVLLSVNLNYVGDQYVGDIEFKELKSAVNQAFKSINSYTTYYYDINSGVLSTIDNSIVVKQKVARINMNAKADQDSEKLEICLVEDIISINDKYYSTNLIDHIKFCFYKKRWNFERRILEKKKIIKIDRVKLKAQLNNLGGI